ncbi:Thioredoxin [Artemisia annua]|uniref:Thioredoxin n=1 Tax=Artemisia annua TaxID=35608 RepID=A0A2U1P9K0_ARTAN|nr:Thioredoxin [Artemisia annua]
MALQINHTFRPSQLTSPSPSAGSSVTSLAKQSSLKLTQKTVLKVGLRNNNNVVRVRSSLEGGGSSVTTAVIGVVTEVDKDTFWPIVEDAGDKTVVLDMYTQWVNLCTCRILVLALLSCVTCVECDTCVSLGLGAICERLGSICFTCCNMLVCNQCTWGQFCALGCNLFHLCAFCTWTKIFFRKGDDDWFSKNRKDGKVDLCAIACVLMHLDKKTGKMLDKQKLIGDDDYKI